MKKTNIPYFYEVHCDNENIYLNECPYYLQQGCKRSCYIFKNTSEDLGCGAMTIEDLVRIKEDLLVIGNERN